MSKFNVKFLLVYILFFNSSFALEFKTEIDVSDINKISIENPKELTEVEKPIVKEVQKQEKEEKIIQKTKTNTEIKEKDIPVIKEVKNEIIKEPLSEEDAFINDENSYLKNIVTISQEVLTTYWKANVFTIPQWKYNILQEFNLSDDEKLTYIIINNIECWREDWFCLSPWKGNVWPFQINFIHTDSYWHSRKLLDEGKKEELYRHQLSWTIERTNRGKKGICKNTFWDSQLSCLLKFHNWNNKEVSDWVKFKDIYAAKGVVFKSLILKHSLDL